MSNILVSETFDDEVLKSELPVLVDFYADWCPPCKMIAPFVEQVSEETEGKAKVFKLNIDESQDIAVRYNVASIPTLIFFKNGEIADRVVGACAKTVISEKLESLM